MHIDLLLEAGDMRSTTTPRPRHLPGRGSLDWYDTALLIHLDLFLCGKVVKHCQTVPQGEQPNRFTSFGRTSTSWLRSASIAASRPEERDRLPSQ